MILRNERGSSLIVAMIAASIVSVLVLSASTLFVQLTQESHRINGALSLSVMRGNVLALLRNPVAWQAIKNDTACNVDMACVAPGSVVNCALDDPANPKKIQCLHDTAGDVIFKADANPLQGFTESGKPCQGYGTNTECVVRPVLTWTCTAQPCGPATPLKVSVKFEYTRTEDLRMNLARFGIDDEIRP